MVNAAGHTYTPDGELELHEPIQPGGTCEINDGYCRAPRVAGGARGKSLVEKLAPFLVPADTALQARWGRDDVAAPPAALTEIEKAAELVKTGIAPTVAGLIASGQVEPPKKRGPGRPPKAR